MNGLIRTLYEICLSVLLVGGAVMTARHLILTRPIPAKIHRKIPPTLVKVLECPPRKERVIIEAFGTVIPSKEITLFPEVRGRVIEQSPKLVPGGLLNAGEVIVRLDDRDYKLALQQAQSTVERASFELRLEEGRQVIAQREWRLLGARQNKISKASKELALRIPHMADARSRLSAARSGLEMARLSVERTVLKAPFNAVVIDESIDEGQVVNQQTRLARLVGTDSFWIRVSLAQEKLDYVPIPTEATIHLDTGDGESHTWDARVERLLSNLDSSGRLARLILSVNDPLGRITGEKPLLLGSYVRVSMQGPILDNVVRLPRKALHDGNIVWVMTRQGKLALRRIRVAWKMKKHVFVKEELVGARIIVSPIPAPVEGMPLKVEE